MALSINTLFYRVFIDPILLPLRKSVLAHVEPYCRIFDVACGTGALVMTMVRTAGYVTGIERLAGGEHYRNFRTYMQLGGIHHFTRQTGITAVSKVIRGGGVFVVTLGTDTAGRGG